MDITLLELHVSDAVFNAPFAGWQDDPGADEASSDDRDAVAGGSIADRLGPLAALLALAGLALLARYLRGSETEQATLDEVEA